jgi:DNA-binding MarR family transcriptional regulator
MKQVGEDNLELKEFVKTYQIMHCSEKELKLVKYLSIDFKHWKIILKDEILRSYAIATNWKSINKLQKMGIVEKKIIREKNGRNLYIRLTKLGLIFQKMATEEKLESEELNLLNKLEKNEWGKEKWKH